MRGTYSLQLHSFNTSYDSVIRIGFGGLVGGTSAVGAWAIVSVLGSASTGTAIASLSGIAATNATLAWFGGGALAAGGAGMSGGMIALSGIISAPIIYFATKNSYKKAEKVRKETLKVEYEHKKIKLLIPDARKDLDKTQIIVKDLIVFIEQYITITNATFSLVFPLGYLSRIIQWLKGFFGSSRFNERQKFALNSLNKETSKLLSTFSYFKIKYN